MAPMKKSAAMKRTTIMLSEALRPGISYERDPLFEDAVFDGPAPRDLSAKHDNYLYDKNHFPVP